MTKEWIKNKEKENRILLDNEIKKCINVINSILEAEDLKTKVFCILNNLINDFMVGNIIKLESELLTYGILKIKDKEKRTLYYEKVKSIDYEKMRMILRNIDIDDLEDSEPMKFDGNIIITDPCYIMKDEDEIEDWNKCNCGYEMEKLGINHYMTRDTIYGDWSCTTFDSDTKKPIGEFCADAGLVSVMLLDEVLKYNPEYNNPEKAPHTVTVINDFKGEVQFIVECEEKIFETTTSYHVKGEKWSSYSVKVVGHGINKKTGKPINFMTSQTGI